jgi:hypothetical protein
MFQPTRKPAFAIAFVGISYSFFFSYMVLVQSAMNSQRIFAKEASFFLRIREKVQQCLLSLLNQSLHTELVVGYLFAEHRCLDTQV